MYVRIRETYARESIIRANPGRRDGETHAFAIDNDRARILKLYFLFREKDSRDQLVEQERTQWKEEKEEGKKEREKG